MKKQNIKIKVIFILLLISIPRNVLAEEDIFVQSDGLTIMNEIERRLLRREAYVVPLGTGILGILPLVNGGTGADLSGINVGDILYYDGSDIVTLSIGSLDEVLYSDGTYPKYKEISDALSEYSDGSSYSDAVAETERTTASTSYVKLKEFTPLARQGTITILCQLKTDNHVDAWSYAELYINGVATGSVVSLNNNINWTNKTIADVSVVRGDVLSMYAKTSSGYNAYIRNFSIRTANPYPSQEVAGY